MQSSLIKLIPESCGCMARRSHSRRFVKPMKFQQNQFMQKFEKKFDRTYKKMMEPSQLRLNSATPYTCIMESEEGIQNVVKKRQNIVNRIFLQNITSILAENEIGQGFRDLKASITQVDVTRTYRHIRIFYYCDKDKISDVVKQLLIVKGPLNKQLIDLNLIGYTPTIEFVYDQASKDHDQIFECLSTADFGPNHQKKDLNEYYPPKEDGPPKSNRPYVPKHIWSLTNFDEAFASSQGENPYEKVEEHAVPQFECPTDMRLDMMRLDYSALIKKVLFDMRRWRKEANLFDPITDPSLPTEWAELKPLPPKPRDPNDLANQYEERIRLMKNFIIENRKKKSIMAREAKKVKREADEEQVERLSSLRDSLDMRYDVNYDMDERLGVDESSINEFYENFANSQEDAVEQKHCEANLSVKR